MCRWHEDPPCTRQVIRMRNSRRVDPSAAAPHSRNSGLLRGIHAREMIGDNTVLKRRKIFIQSARIILLMVVEFVIALLVIA